MKLIWLHSLNNNVSYWNICTCYDWNCIHCGGFVTCISIPLYRKPSFGFGVKYTILTFCRCCVAIFIYFNLLLRFISDAANYIRGVLLKISSANFISERGNGHNVHYGHICWLASKRGSEDISGDNPEVKENNPGYDPEVSSEVLDEMDDMKRTKSLAKDLLDKKVGETYDNQRPVRPKDFTTLEEIKKEYSSFFDEDSENNTTEGLQDVLDYLNGELSNLSGNTSGSKEMKKEIDNIFKEEEGNSNKKLKTESEAETEAKPSKGKGKEVEAEAEAKPSKSKEAEAEANPSKGKEVEAESQAPKVEGEVKPTNEKPEKTSKDIPQNPVESKLPGELSGESEDWFAEIPIYSDDLDTFIYPKEFYPLIRPDDFDHTHIVDGIDFFDIINIIFKIL